MSDMKTEDLSALGQDPQAGVAPEQTPPAEQMPPTPPPPAPPPPAETQGDSILARLKAKVLGREPRNVPDEEDEADTYASAMPPPTGETLLNYPGYETDFAKVFDSDDRAGAQVALQRILTQTARAAHESATDDANHAIAQTVKKERAAQTAQGNAQENVQLVREYILGEVNGNEGVFQMIAPFFVQHLNELTGGDPSKEPDNIKNAMAMAKKTFAHNIDAATKKSPDGGTTSMKGASPQNTPQTDPFESFMSEMKKTDGFRG